MAIPNLNKEDVKEILSYATDIGNPIKGGQKIVFPITLENKKFVLKFMLTNPSRDNRDEMEQSEDEIDEVTARARREVEVMKICVSPYLVKLGPIPLTHLDYKGQSLIFFAEEFIEGRDLKNILISQEKLPVNDVIRLGRNITEAIRVIWSYAKIHRDIKPGNIMFSDRTGDFILLDMGLVFDLFDESITLSGIIPGTPIYFSPEQIDLARKRQMDFRSDLFSLGIVLYEAVTGRHPFIGNAQSTTDVVANILSSNPSPPITSIPNLPESLNTIIMRLLAKKPHLRYRTCEQLDAAFAEIS